MKLRRKIASRDFTENMMPQTRKEVFFDVLKLSWFDLLKLGLVLLIAFLPVLIMAVTNDAYEAKLMAEVGENASQEALLQVRSSVIFFRNTSAFICIPFYMLFALVLSGALRLIRQYAWEEVVFFWRDLWTGIKQNWKQTVLLALLISLQSAVGQYLNGTGSLMQDMTVKIAGGAFSGILWLIFFPVYAYMLIGTGIYSNSFLQNMKMGFALYAKAPLKTVLVLLGLSAVFLASLLPQFIAHLIGQVAGILLLPILLLIWFLFVSAQLDKYINPAHFPELVGRGLYQEVFNKTEKEDLCE